MLLVAYPMFAWLASVPTLQTLLWVWVIFGVLIAGYHGSLPALMSELFPTRTRTTGLSISYAFGVMFFGGFAPFILTWLIEVDRQQARAELLPHVRRRDQHHRTRRRAWCGVSVIVGAAEQHQIHHCPRRLAGTRRAGVPAPGWLRAT